VLKRRELVTTEQLMRRLLTQVQAMSEAEKAKLREILDRAFGTRDSIGGIPSVQRLQ
jgi:hypothetical protein